MENTFSAQETTRKRRRWGCTCGCLVFFIALILGGFGLLFYIFRANPELPKEQWMTSATDGFGIVRISSDDQGMTDLVAYLMRLFEARQKPNVSEQDRKAVTAAMTLFRQFTDNFVQRDLYVYFAFNPGTQREDVLVVGQFRYLASWLLLKMILTKTGIVPVQADKEVQLFPRPGAEHGPDPAFGVTRKFFVAGNDPDAIRAAVVPSVSPEKQGKAPDRLTDYLSDLSMETPEAGEDVAAVFLNTEGRPDAWLPWLDTQTGMSGTLERVRQILAERKLTTADIVAAKVSGDVVSADKIKLTFSFYCRKPDTAKKLLDVLKVAVLPQITKTAENAKITRRADAKLENNTAVLLVEISGIKAWAQQTFGVTPTPAATPKAK